MKYGDIIWKGGLEFVLIDDLRTEPETQPHGNGWITYPPQYGGMYIGPFKALRIWVLKTVFNIQPKNRYGFVGNLVDETPESLKRKVLGQ